MHELSADHLLLLSEFLSPKAADELDAGAIEASLGDPPIRILRRLYENGLIDMTNDRPPRFVITPKGQNYLDAAMAQEFNHPHFMSVFGQDDMESADPFSTVPYYSAGDLSVSGHVPSETTRQWSRPVVSAAASFLITFGAAFALYALGGGESLGAILLRSTSIALGATVIVILFRAMWSISRS